MKTLISLFALTIMLSSCDLSYNCVTRYKVGGVIQTEEQTYSDVTATDGHCDQQEEEYGKLDSFECDCFKQ